MTDNNKVVLFYGDSPDNSAGAGTAIVGTVSGWIN